jgi:hypothetical protein
MEHRIFKSRLAFIAVSGSLLTMMAGCSVSGDPGEPRGESRISDDDSAPGDTVPESDADTENENETETESEAQAVTGGDDSDTENKDTDDATVTDTEVADTESVVTDDTGSGSDTDKDSDSSDGAAIYIDCQAGSDSNSGRSATSALRTLSKASSIEIHHGDRIFLKSGTVCEGTLDLDLGASVNVDSKETSISTYGGTSPAHIFAAKTLSLDWARVTNPNINGKPIPYLQGTPLYSAPLDFEPGGVFAADTLQRFPQARHPNNEWEFMDGIETAYCDQGQCHLKGWIYSFAEFGLSGDEKILYRLNNWHVDKRKVTYYDPDSHWMGLDAPFNQYYIDSVVGGWGYRLANSLACTDTAGEWVYDTANQRLTMWAPNNQSPPSQLIVSAYSSGLKLQGANARYSAQNLVISFSKGHGIEVTNTGSAAFFNVSVHSANEYALLAFNVGTLDIRECSFDDNNMGGNSIYGVGTLAIRDSSYRRNGRFGTQQDIGQQLSAITAADIGGHAEISGNTIEWTGYAGIILGLLRGTYAIENNHVWHFCSVLNDCGGIYFQGQSQTALPGVVEGNNVRYAYGNDSGNPTKGSVVTGVYLDWMMSDVTLLGNSIESASSEPLGSIFIHGGHNNVVRSNTMRAKNLGDPSIFAHFEWTTGTNPYNNLYKDNICLDANGSQSSSCVKEVYK